MYVSTPAIIIKTQKYKEFDEIITAFTKKFGKVSMFAHSSKRIKSKLLSGTQVFSYVDMELDLRQTSSRLFNSKSNDSFYNFSQNLHKYYLASYLCEIIDKTQTENQTELRLFDVFLQTFRIMKDKEVDLRLLRLIFELHLIDALGIKPNLLSCSICRQTNPDLLHNIDMITGTLVCDECLKLKTPNIFTLDKNLIRFIKYVYNKNIEISVNAKISPILVEMLDEFNYNYILSFYGDLKLHSIEILKQEEKYDKSRTSRPSN